MTETPLLDNSAWARFADPALSDERLTEIADALEAGRIATCLPFLLEAGFSARNARDHGELLALRHFGIDEEVERRAVAAQRQLARIGHHRLPPVHLIVAAVADRHDLGVLHYDRDYDFIAEKTDLELESVWLAPDVHAEHDEAVGIGGGRSFGMAYSGEAPVSEAWADARGRGLRGGARSPSAS